MVVQAWVFQTSRELQHFAKEIGILISKGYLGKEPPWNRFLPTPSLTPCLQMHRDVIVPYRRAQCCSELLPMFSVWDFLTVWEAKKSLAGRKVRRVASSFIFASVSLLKKEVHSIEEDDLISQYIHDSLLTILVQTAIRHWQALFRLLFIS